MRIFAQLAMAKVRWVTTAEDRYAVELVVYVADHALQTATTSRRASSDGLKWRLSRTTARSRTCSCASASTRIGFASRIAIMGWKCRKERARWFYVTAGGHSIRLVGFGGRAAPGRSRQGLPPDMHRVVEASELSRLAPADPDVFTRGGDIVTVARSGRSSNSLLPLQLPGCVANRLSRPTSRISACKKVTRRGRTGSPHGRRPRSSPRRA